MAAYATVVRRLFLPVRRRYRSPAERDRITAEQARLVEQLAGVDAELVQVMERRLDVITELEATYSMLDLSMEEHRGRRPPKPWAAPLAAVSNRARVVGGRPLRAVILAVLTRHGAMSLPELHSYLHRYGYRVYGSHPAKALSAACTYEVACGRLVRLRRGWYGLNPTWHPPKRRRSASPDLGPAPSDPTPPSAAEMLDPLLATDANHWFDEIDEIDEIGEIGDADPVTAVDDTVRVHSAVPTDEPIGVPGAPRPAAGADIAAACPGGRRVRRAWSADLRARIRDALHRVAARLGSEQPAGRRPAMAGTGP